MCGCPWPRPCADLPLGVAIHPTGRHPPRPTVPLPPPSTLASCCALQLEAAPGWAWAGVTVFAALSALNLFWFAKLLAMARGGVSNRGEGHGEGDRSGLGGSSGAARAARRSAGVNVTFELVGGGKGSKAA